MDTHRHRALYHAHCSPSWHNLFHCQCIPLTSTQKRVLQKLEHKRLHISTMPPPSQMLHRLRRPSRFFLLTSLRRECSTYTCLRRERPQYTCKNVTGHIH